MLICTTTLKSVTYRLTATPSKQLPRVAAQIASSLWNCRQLLSLPSEELKQDSEAALVITRFRTYLTNLLQDRTVEGRWAAVVLVKATIEAGGVETLSKSNAFVKNLLAILKKPDPSTTRILAVITLTRIFSLTWEYTNLIREITTPVLPGFVSTCLSNVENARCSDEEVLTILESFATLIDRHPTIFRTSESQIRVILLRIISNTDARRYFTHKHQHLAYRVMVLLHHCAPKQGSAEQRGQSFKNIIAASHETCDRLFRSILEDWQSTANVHPSAQANVLNNGEAELEHDPFMGLPGWSGVPAGSERLVALLRMLEMHISTASTAIVSVRLGLLADLISRILSVTTREGVKLNSQIAKHEREVLFALLPQAHVMVMGVITTLLRRFGTLISSVMLPLLTQILWMFQAERYDSGVRIGAYVIVKSFLKFQGLSMAREDAADLETVMKTCCEDLAQSTNGKRRIEDTAMKITSASGIESSNAKGKQPDASTEVSQAAADLLPILIANVNPSHVSRRLRALLERTAVLTCNKDALLACVLSPMNAGNKMITQPSLLPIFARQCPATVEAELLLRPRMPVIRAEPKVTHDEDDSDDEAVGNNQDIELDEAAPETQNLIDEDFVFHQTAIHNKNEITVDRERLIPTSTTTPQLEVGTVLEKRPAPSERIDAGPDQMKRPRLSPQAADEVLLDNATPVVPADTVLASQPEVSGNTVPIASEQAISVPAASLTSSVQFAQNNEDEDDEEMEIPTLTMEDSSDDE